MVDRTLFTVRRTTRYYSFSSLIYNVYWDKLKFVYGRNPMLPMWKRITTVCLNTDISSICNPLPTSLRSWTFFFPCSDFLFALPVPTLYFVKVVYRNLKLNQFFFHVFFIIIPSISCKVDIWRDCKCKFRWIEYKELNAFITMVTLKSLPFYCCIY